MKKLLEAGFIISFSLIAFDGISPSFSSLKSEEEEQFEIKPVSASSDNLDLDDSPQSTSNIKDRSFHSVQREESKRPGTIKKFTSTPHIKNLHQSQSTPSPEKTVNERNWQTISVSEKSAPTESDPVSTHSIQDISLEGNLVLKTFRKENLAREEAKELRDKVLNLGGKGVPILIHVMKEDQFPDRNRWLATIFLGRLMGKKASPFIAKFFEHPSWFMRAAGLKTLLALNEKRYGKEYAERLFDDSLLVRTQALENIRHLQMVEFAPQVWKMMFNKQNYKIVDGKLKRTPIISSVVKAIGDLHYSKAKEDLFKLSQKKSYDDIFQDIDYSLEKLVKKKSPKQGTHEKRVFWARLSLNEVKIE